MTFRRVRRLALWAKQGAFQENVECVSQATAARRGRFGRIEPRDEVAAMARRERLKRPPRLGMRFQAASEVRWERKLSRFAVDAKLDADKVTNVGARGFAQSRVDLHAKTAAAGRHQSGARQFAVHDGNHRDVLGFCRFDFCGCAASSSHLLLKLANDVVGHVDVPHHPDAIDRGLKTMEFDRHTQRRLSVKNKKAGPKNWTGLWF